MNLTQTLFSFGGRIRRSTFWLYAIGLNVVVWVVWGIGFAIGMMNSSLGIVSLVISVVAYAALVWGGLALYIKRLHDKDMMWAWIFCPIYPAIVAMFLDGTQGPNRFGASPKGITGPAIAAS